jgi:hypothetical protein
LQEWRGDKYVDGTYAVSNHFPGTLAKRQSLIDLGVLLQQGNVYVFTQDYAFNSPSLASTVVLGRSSNGRTDWKDAQGRSLKVLQEDEPAKLCG